MYDFWNASDKAVKDKTSTKDASSGALAQFIYSAGEAQANLLNSKSAFQPGDQSAGDKGAVADKGAEKSKDDMEDNRQRMADMDRSRSNEAATAALPSLTLTDSSSSNNQSNSDNNQLARAA